MNAMKLVYALAGSAPSKSLLKAFCSPVVTGLNTSDFFKNGISIENESVEILEDKPASILL